MSAAVSDPIQAPGTPESCWQEWPGLRSLPQRALPRRGPVVVVAAHPDDEVLGFGGAMALLAAAGVPLRLVAVTDGEASHPDAAMGPAALAARRRRETELALAELGVAEAETVQLGVPDTGVAEHEAAVRQALTTAVEGASLCVAPWTGDVHADHEAAGRAAAAAAGAAGVECLFYPVWTWHWARPGDARVPWDRAARIDLEPQVLRRKKAAVDRFVTQLRPLEQRDGSPGEVILPPGELAHHLRPFEVVLR
ncbi:PIG-L deacetylase family protein [Streptomyces sp. NPDC059740]|uniref:PIG-L deacetylase family protein n=1 Tax=Streptomyces sp. NPDC059740 TaxID=3346926 RepID=UPI00364B8BE0